MTLDEIYRGHNVSFRYPGHWELEEEARDDAVTITIGDSGASGQ